MLKHFLIIGTLFFCMVTGVKAQEVSPEPDSSTIVPIYYNATVLKVVPRIDENDPSIDTKIADITLQIQGGERNKQEVTAAWTNDENLSRDFPVRPGTKLIITCVVIPEGEICDIVDQQRSTGLIFLAFVFLVAIWLISKKHGMKAVITMVLGLVVILFVIIPLILKGISPLPVTIIAGLVIIVPTIYISHGFNAKSHIALLSILGATIVIALLAIFFTSVLHLSGTTGEEALYLNANINLRAVLLSAIVLGAFGVIDDIAMTQVSIVNELHHSNPKLSSLSLFKRAMQVGQDHISSVVNTLFLAYVGVSLPLLILIQQSGLPFFVAIQQEAIATEIMRTLIGTIGLVLVVPLTTYIASEIIVRRPELFPAGEHHHSH